MKKTLRTLIGPVFGAVLVHLYQTRKNANTKVTPTQPLPEGIVQRLKNLGLQQKGYYDTYLKLKKQPHYFDDMVKQGRLSDFRVFHGELDLKEQQTIAVVFRPTEYLQAHKEIVHGGCSATIIDNFFGVAASISNGFKPSATAQLELQYKSPVRVGAFYLLQVKVTKQKDRKTWVAASLVDEQGKLCVSATGLMISVSWEKEVWSTLAGYLSIAKDKQ